MIDLSGAMIDDDAIAGELAKAIRTVRLLGANCVIAGMQTGLARSLEPLMADLGSARSFSCMEHALEEALKIVGYEIRQKH